MGLTAKERKIAIEALVSIASEARVECLSAEMPEDRALPVSSRIEDIERLCFGKRRAVPQDARQDFILMRGPGGSLEKIEGNTRQDLWVLRGSQSLPQTPESRLLLAKHG